MVLGWSMPICRLLVFCYRAALEVEMLRAQRCALSTPEESQKEVGKLHSAFFACGARMRARRKKIQSFQRFQQRFPSGECYMRDV